MTTTIRVFVYPHVSGPESNGRRLPSFELPTTSKKEIVAKARERLAERNRLRAKHNLPPRELISLTVSGR